MVARLHGARHVDFRKTHRRLGRHRMPLSMEQSLATLRRAARIRFERASRFMVSTEAGLQGPDSARWPGRSFDRCRRRVPFPRCRSSLPFGPLTSLGWNWCFERSFLGLARERKPRNHAAQTRSEKREHVSFIRRISELLRRGQRWRFQVMANGAIARSARGSSRKPVIAICGHNVAFPSAWQIGAK